MPAETVVASGMIDRLGLADSVFTAKYGDGQKFKLTRDITHDLAATLLLEELKDLGIIDHFEEITGSAIAWLLVVKILRILWLSLSKRWGAIEALAEYAPLHNPTQTLYSCVPKIITAGHSSGRFWYFIICRMPKENYLYSIPYEYYQKFGARKYGAHGTVIVMWRPEAAELLGKPLSELKLITLHLGSVIDHRL